MDPYTLHGARANRRLMEVAQHTTLFGEPVLHRGILWFLQPPSENTTPGVGAKVVPAEEEEWTRLLFFLHGRSRLSRLVRNRDSTIQDVPAQMELLCDIRSCTRCVLRPRKNRPFVVCLCFRDSINTSEPANWEMELAADSLAELAR